MEKTGLWLIGARGGVATTAILGLEALRRGLTTTTGLVTESPLGAGLPFVEWSDVVVGGHDIRGGSLVEQASDLADRSRAFDLRLVKECVDGLRAVDAEIRNGTVRECGDTIASLEEPGESFPAATPRVAIQRFQNDWAEFRSRHGLKSLVVVNVASTEPPLNASQFPDGWLELEPLLDQPECRLPASAVYAIAALDAGLPYVNFTPSTGCSLPAIGELAWLRGACHTGKDGKTGETLLKSVLGPMFAARNLEVLSWVGHNIFGNRDGQVLDDPANKASKVASKDRLLPAILGYSPQTHVSIEYIRSLGDWKTAWDHIHFAGFLGTPMTMQFTWQGCDSILAAPLVLDLFRLVELASRRGAVGPLPWLASFFKSPEGTVEHDFQRQFAMLANQCEAWRSETIPTQTPPSSPDFQEAAR